MRDRVEQDGESMNRVLTEFIPARQVSLTDRVHDQILELIIKNATEEEMVLTEKKLMELLGVSKAPVREALIKLCSEEVLINVWISCRADDGKGRTRCEADADAFGDRGSEAFL